MGLLQFIIVFGHICGRHACCSIEQLQDRVTARCRDTALHAA
jgi:hypothetical protein